MLIDWLFKMELVKGHALLAAIDIAHLFLFDDSDNDEDNRNEKDDYFLEETVPRFSDQQFKQHFRMLPTSFEDLVVKIHAVSGTHAISSGRPEEPLEKQLLITLWCLANIECFR